MLSSVEQSPEMMMAAMTPSVDAMVETFDECSERNECYDEVSLLLSKHK